MIGAVDQDLGDHVAGLKTEVRVVHAVAEEGAVESEGVSAGEVGDAGFREQLVDGEFRGHDRVVGRGKDRVHAVGDQRLGSEGDFVHRGAGALNEFHALLLQKFLRGGNGGGGGVLTQVIQQADLGGLLIGGEDQIHDGGGVQKIGGAGEVAARDFEALDKARAHGIGDGGEDDGDLVVLGGGLHGHGDRGRDADHQVNALGDEVRDDLVHNVRVGLAVVVQDLKFHALLFGDGVKLVFDVFHDLVEGGVVHEVADADLVALFSGGGSRAERENEAESQQHGNDLFHFDRPFCKSKKCLLCVWMVFSVQAQGRHRFV